MAFVADARGVEIVRIDELGREISPLRDLMATIRLARLIRKERPQILHTHTAKAGTVGRVAARLAGSRKPPIVVHTFHGHVLRGYFGPVRTLFFRLLERWLAAGTTALIAVSPQVRDDLVALGVAPRERFVVIRLGIELDERVAPEQNGRAESRRYLGIPGDRFAVGWIGRMTAVKRTDDVLIAFKSLRDSGVDAVLCMVGDGPDRLPLEQRAHELGVARDTVFLGYQEDVAPFYAAFDVLVLPSGNEGTPVTVIEALAAERARRGHARRRCPRRRPRRRGRLSGRGRSDRRPRRPPRPPRTRSGPTRAHGQEGPRARAAALCGGAARRRRRRALQVAAQCGRRAKTLKDGFFLPAAVRKPDCQPIPRFVSSRSMNHTIRSMRGFARAIAKDWRT